MLASVERQPPGAYLELAGGGEQALAHGVGIAAALQKAHAVTSLDQSSCQRVSPPCCWSRLCRRAAARCKRLTSAMPMAAPALVLRLAAAVVATPHVIRARRCMSSNVTA